MLFRCAVEINSDVITLVISCDFLLECKPPNSVFAYELLRNCKAVCCVIDSTTPDTTDMDNLSRFCFLFVVEQIDRQHGVIARGRLAQLLTEGPSPNPRWLVKFDSQPYKDEEMYERAFGKLLHSVEETEEQPAAPAEPEATSSGTSRKTSISSTNSAAETAIESKGSGASGEGDKSDDNKKSEEDAKAVQFQKSGTLSNDSADDSGSPEEMSRSARSRASAREARSRRRQAMIDDASVPPGTEILAGKRKMPPPPGHRSKQFKTEAYAEDGEVVKVKLLTGTLYLYRGAQRRVEFVRRV